MTTDEELERRLAAMAGVDDDDLPDLPEAAWIAVSRPESASVLAARQLAEEARRRPHASRRRRRRQLLAAAAVVGVAAVGVVVGLPGGGPPGAFADWTSTPEDITPAAWAEAEAACIAQLDETTDLGGVFAPLADPTAVLVDRRGSWTYTVLVSAPSPSGEQRFGDCLSTDSPSPLGGSSLNDDPVAAEPTSGVVVVSGHSVSASDQDGASTYTGRSAPDVVAVTVLLPDGNGADALVRDGWWSVWFPGDTIDLDPSEITVRSTLVDGTVQEAPLATLWG